MPQVDVELDNTITLTNSGIDGATATQVGSPPVWEDDSDATYVELEGAYFNDGSIFHSRAVCSVSNQTLTGLSPSNPGFKCYLSLRISGVQPGLPFLQAQIRQEGGSSLPSLNPATAPSVPDSAGWVTVEMVGGVEELWNAPTAYEIQFQSANASLSDGSFLTIKGWRIYEVRVYFEVPVRSAPPCQLFPADTKGSVGGAVGQFPGSRSRQRSGGAVGYY